MKNVTFLILGILLLGMQSNAQEVVAGWTFPGSSAEADTGIVANIGNEIYTIGGTSDIEFKNGIETKAAQVTGWQDGMNSKAWVVEFSTEGYTNLSISSRQQSGGNDPGPKDFKLQYSIDEGIIWLNVPDVNFVVENNWETAFVDAALLPNECFNKPKIMIRWLMVSNEASGDAGDVLETGKSKIDDIYVHGKKVSNVNNNRISKVNLGPNPASDFISIKSESIIEEILMIDNSGRTVVKLNPNSPDSTINLEGMPSGMYLVLVKSKEEIKPSAHKILIK